MITLPRINRQFDAVDIFVGTKNYFLNRPRLETAIAIISLVGFKPQEIVKWMMEEYPTMTSVLAEYYLEAAQLCIAYKLTV